MRLILAMVAALTSAATTYIPPVSAPVTDPFRPPASPYGPGNRGLEYGTEPGQPVWASADGVVEFAGAVAGSLYVTVSHADGIRTTYSYLAEIYVARGEHVSQGHVLGVTGDHPFFFSARAGDTYIDPATLFEGGPPRVWLVPEAPGPEPARAGPVLDWVPAARIAAVDVAIRR